MTERLRVRGFDLRLENGFAADAAREVVERVLGTKGDRVHFVATAGGAKVFVKAEFRRPSDALGKRLRTSRAVREGRGLRAFAAAGLPVPRLLAFGEQPKWKPRAGALVVTEKLPGHDASWTLQRHLRADLVAAVAGALGTIHARGFVHGDAALRNFLPLESGMHVVDVPRWAKWTAEGAEDDLAHVVGSALKAGALKAFLPQALDAYRAAAGAAAQHLPAGWEGRVLAAGETYLAWLIERDRTRKDRRAKREASPLRSKGRGEA